MLQRLTICRSRVLCTMTSYRNDEEEAYKAAISTLNKLQTNAAVLELVRRRKADVQVSEYNRMQQYLQRVGLTPADLRRLNAIHVSGTKGKGSVCALTESILRHHSYKTGLFVSPHLLEVRERIRINGKPLSKAAFVYHFWDVYSKLLDTKHLYSGAMPAYFRFLTVMAFSVFLQNKVDVAIVEVGIGGTHDSTNIIEHPAVCGITSLGYDHTDILGSTLSDIAWHKGGICKEQCPVITVEQAPESMAALCSRTKELRAQSFCVAPPLSSYPGPLPELGLKGKHQATNASLAAQLSHTWLQKHNSSEQTTYYGSLPVASDDEDVPRARPFHLTQQFRDGLQMCRWAGRNQVVKQENVTYYLDGAHTPESMKASADWFQSELSTWSGEHDVKVLIFNTTGLRDSAVFLLPLVVCGFNYVIFCPNIGQAPDSPFPNSADQTSQMVTYDSQLARCYANEQSFKEVLATSLPVTESGDEQSRESVTRICVSVSDALHFVDTLSPAQVAVLVSGSLHLVGTVMSVLGFTAADV